MQGGWKLETGTSLLPDFQCSIGASVSLSFPHRKVCGKDGACSCYLYYQAKEFSKQIKGEKRGFFAVPFLSGSFQQEKEDTELLPEESESKCMNSIWLQSFIATRSAAAVQKQPWTVYKQMCSAMF